MQFGRFRELLARLESLRPRSREAIELIARSVCDATEYLAQAWVMQVDEVLRSGRPEDAEEVKDFLNATLGITEEQGDDRVTGAVRFWQEILLPFLPRDEGPDPEPKPRVPGD